MPYVQGDMKDLNRRAVFDLIAEVGEISRVDIGNTLGTSSPTVLKITNFFQERGIVTMSGEEKTARGRRPQLLRFDPDSILGVGVDYCGHSVKVALCNYWGASRASLCQAVDGDFDTLTDTLLPQMIRKLIAQAKVPPERVRGVGLCLPGAVNTDNAQVQLGALSGVKMQRTPAESIRLLSQKMGLPFYLFNDVNAAARGEYVLRRLRDDDLIYLSAGEGIGAGIILDGKLRTGKHFYTGEIAHIVFDPNYITDISQPGWFEARLSPDALQDKFPQQGSAEQVRYVAQYLALAIANICNILDVQTVILGGELIERMGDALMRETTEYARRLCMFQVQLDRPSCTDPALVGTAAMALERELDNILSDNL